MKYFSYELPGSVRYIDHGVQHSGDEDWFACNVAFGDYGFLDQGKLLGPNVQAQVATTEHETISFLNDGAELEQRLARL